MSIKKIILPLFALLFLFAGSACARTIELEIGEKYVEIQQDGYIDSVNLDVAPKIVNDRTLVPIRAVAENLGGKVYWDDKTRTATISGNNNGLQLTLGSKKAKVNGKEVELDVPANTENGRTLVPLRFVSESLGYTVYYVDMTQDIIITDLSVIMQVNGNNISMETYNLLKYLKKYDYDTMSSKDMVEASRGIYDELATIYKKYSYVISKGDTLSKEKIKEIKDKLNKEYEDEELSENILYGVYISLEEKKAYAEIYDSKYASAQGTSYNDKAIRDYYTENYMCIDALRLENKGDNLDDAIQMEAYVAENGFDKAVENFKNKEGYSVKSQEIFSKEDFENEFFEIGYDLEINGVSECSNIGDKFCILRKSKLPALSEDTKKKIIEKLGSDAVKNVEDVFGQYKVEELVSSDDALDLAE